MRLPYVVWSRSNAVKNSCVLNELVGVDEIFQLTIGTPLADKFPENVHFTLHPDFPHHLVLIDSLNNINRVIVGSKRLSDFLQARNPKCVEYLPVGIMGHKRKMLSRQYSIIHPIEPVDCLDIDRSGVSWNKLVEGKIRSVKRIVLDPARLDPDREIFRLNRFFEVILVRRDVAEAIDKEQFSGIRWVNLEDYPEN
jgi:hypothetical protein